MAFGQASGPPASAKQIQQLAELLEARGFDSFREARHPFGLTQRQASGKFTVTEATDLIEQLEADQSRSDDVGPDEVGPDAAATAAPARGRGSRAEVARTTAARGGSDRVAERAMRRQEDAAVDLLSEVMATELTNRGWCCIPPPEA